MQWTYLKLVYNEIDSSKQNNMPHYKINAVMCKSGMTKHSVKNVFALQRGMRHSGTAAKSKPLSPIVWACEHLIKSVRLFGVPNTVGIGWLGRLQKFMKYKLTSCTLLFRMNKTSLLAYGPTYQTVPLTIVLLKEVPFGGSRFCLPSSGVKNYQNSYFYLGIPNLQASQWILITFQWWVSDKN